MLLTVQALVLGLVQGLTEFLPVSSSGHLQAVPYLLGWRSGDLAFDVVVHAGTLAAVVVAFRADLVALARGTLALAGTTPEEVRTARRMVALLGVATLPAAIAGLLLGDVLEAAFASPRAIAASLLVTALLLWGSEMLRRRRGGDEKEDVGTALHAVGTREALAVGLAQALAILPGVSRSGATIATGMALGLSRRAAARFSLLLSIPIILGTTVVMLPELASPPADALPFGPAEVAIGVAAATVSGYVAIRVLLRMLERRSLLPFAVYVTLLAAVLVAVSFARA